MNNIRQGRKNTLITMYGKTLYDHIHYVLPNKTEKKFDYPGIALYDYLNFEERLHIDNFIILGTGQSYWYNLLVNIRDYLASRHIDFPFAEKFFNPVNTANNRYSGTSVNSTVQTDDQINAGKIASNTFCAMENISVIENEINKVMEKNFGCHFTLLVHTDDLSTVNAQSDIIRLLFDRKELILDSDVYFDATNGMRFIPLLLLTGLNCLRITDNLTIKNIYYAQYREDLAEFRNLKKIDTLFNESLIYDMCRDTTSIKPLAKLIEDEKLKQTVKNIDGLINMQNYESAAGLMNKNLGRLYDNFSDSMLLGREFIKGFYSAINDRSSELICEYLKSLSLFNVAVLSELRYRYLHIKPKLTNNGFNDYRNKIMHYQLASNNQEIDKVRNLPKELGRILSDDGIICRNSQPQGKKSKPVFFSFLGSGKYWKINYHSNSLGTFASRFLGNTLAGKMFCDNTISKYIVCGTFTSGWKVFIDTLLEQYESIPPKLDAIKQEFYKKLTVVTDNQNNTDEKIILDCETTKGINKLFREFAVETGRDIEIYAYDEEREYKLDFRQLSEFIAGRVADRQNFMMDITHSFRDIPLVAFMSAVSIMSKKNSVLKKLYYGYMDPRIKETSDDGSKSGYLVDLAYLTGLIRDTKSISLFNETANLRYLSSLINEHFDNRDLNNKVETGILLENLMIFKRAATMYSEVFEALQNSELLGIKDDPVFRLIYPMMEDKLKSSTWDDDLSGLAKRAGQYINNGCYTMAICAVYECYQRFAKQIKVFDNNFRSYIDKSAELNQIFNKFHLALIDAFKATNDSMREYDKDSTITKYVMKAYFPQGKNTSFIIRKLRRYVTHELDSKSNEKSEIEHKFYIISGEVNFNGLKQTLNNAVAEIGGLREFIVKLDTLRAEVKKNMPLKKKKFISDS